VQGIQYCILTQNNWQKGLGQKKGEKVLIFVEIVENQTPNLWEIVYSPNHTITNTLHKVYFAYFILQLLKFWKMEFKIVQPHFLK